MEYLVQAGRAKMGAGKAVPGVREVKRSASEVVEPRCQEKPLSVRHLGVPVPQTDTGRRVENTKANGRTLVKELGKIAP